MKPSSHRLPRSLLLSVGLHLGVGVWLWTRREPEAPPAAALQVPLTLHLAEVELPPRAASPQPGVSAPTPTRRAHATPSPRRSSPRLAETAESPAPPGAQGGVPTYFSDLGSAEMRITEVQMPPDQHLYKRVRLLEARTCGAGVSCFKAPGD